MSCLGVVKAFHETITSEDGEDHLLHILFTIKGMLKSNASPTRSTLCDMGLLRLLAWQLGRFQDANTTIALLEVLCGYLLDTASQSRYTSLFLLYYKQDSLNNILSWFTSHSRIVYLCSKLIILMTFASNNTSFLQLEANLLQHLLRILYYIENKKTLKTTISATLCLIQADNSGLSSKHSFFKELITSLWEVLQDNLKRVYIAKIICEIITQNSPELLFEADLDLASLLLSILRMTSSDNECGSLALAAISSCCACSETFNSLLYDFHFIDEIMAIIWLFRKDMIAQKYIYASILSVYYRGNFPYIQALISCGAISVEQEVILRKPTRMWKMWKPFLHALLPSSMTV